jgi:hypothetical protein
MIGVQTISIVIASAGVFIAAIYYIFQLRHQNRMRQTDLVMRLYSTRGSKEFQEALKNVMTAKPENYKDYENLWEWSDFLEVLIFFEGIGILLSRKLIDIKLVDDLFSTLIKASWEKIRFIVEGVRKYHNSPQIAEYFEYLYNEMQKREQKLQQKGAKNG